jgi:hypothetical protein
VPLHVNNARATVKLRLTARNTCVTLCSCGVYFRVECKNMFRNFRLSLQTGFRWNLEKEICIKFSGDFNFPSYSSNVNLASRSACFWFKSVLIDRPL